MEAKKGLNNTQRKVLEEIYVGRIDGEKRTYERERRSGRQDFVEASLEKERNSNPIKSILAADRKRAELLEKNAEYLKEKGIYFNNKYKLEIRYNSGYDCSSVVSDYDDETSNTVDRYNKAKQEVRAKIWGLDTSYEEIEAEIDAVLAKF